MVALSQTEPATRFDRYEDLRRWTESQPGYRSLVRGAPMPGPSPSRRHQALVARFYLLLVAAVARPGRGEVSFAPLAVKLAEDTVRQPDLLLVLAEHADRLRETHLEGAPGLVVEVLSPATARPDLWEKRHDYNGPGSRSTGWWTPMPASSNSTPARGPAQAASCPTSGWTWPPFPGAVTAEGENR